jgi:hypothetical protein
MGEIAFRVLCKHHDYCNDYHSDDFFSKISCSFCEYVNSFHGFGDEQENNL